ncbi:MAG TPA: class II aldolase/adducin family protein [Fimbriimonadales bacterium]|nr:class II aldolase/adducin family protein [Fimbriimonadales bacterium]
MSQHKNRYPSETALRFEMCRIAKRLWERGLIGASEGNVSCRFDENHLLITPCGVIKGDLEPHQLVVTDLHGKPISYGEPSSEFRMHIRIYRELPECFAVVHAHPPTATGFAIAGKTIPHESLPEVEIVLGKVALVPFATPGTDEMGNVLVPFLQSHKTFLLRNHGAVTIGGSLEEAYIRMETLERIAHMLFVAHVMQKES